MLSNKKNATKKLFLDFGLFDFFLTKKQPKLTKNEENWQNPNCSMKFFEIWYVDTSLQKKMLQKNYFLISAFFVQTAKIDQNEENWQNLIHLIIFFEIWYVDAF